MSVTVWDMEGEADRVEEIDEEGDGEGDLEEIGEAEWVMLVTLVRVPLGEVLEDIVSDLVTDGE